MRLVFIVLILGLLGAGCASRKPGSYGPAGDLEVAGEGTASFPGPHPDTPANFVWMYETEAWRSSREQAFHHLRTDLRLAFDPATGEISNVTVESTGEGHAFRHLCLTPGPAGTGLLTIRMTTLLDDREEDLTVVRVHSTDPSTHLCEEYGVGPRDGLVEGVDVLFKPDGTFKVLPNTGAYLAGSGLKMERRMTVSPDLEEVAVDELP